MSAKEHTRSMLEWWAQSGIERVDLVVRTRSDGMAWHSGLGISELPLGWARFENSRGGEVFIRPARGCAWPLVLLDDVNVSLSMRIARKYAALCVHTSPAGGCHLWLRCSKALKEGERREAQRWLAARAGGDPGSTSGEHLGRLAGFKNWKRGGVWINVLTASTGQPWDVADLPPPEAEGESGSDPAGASTRRRLGRTGVDHSPSGREWGQTCRALEGGQDPRTVYEELVLRARPRRGPDAERYAERTLEHASRHVKEHRP